MVDVLVVTGSDDVTRVRRSASIATLCAIVSTHARRCSPWARRP